MGKIEAASGSDELKAAVRGCRAALTAVGAVSGLVNLLMLTAPLFMLQVYDRVLPSRSLPTLVALGLLALTLFAFQAGLEAIRARILSRVSAELDGALSGRVFAAFFSGIGRPVRGADGQQALRDLDTVRAFVAGPACGALFDLPWMPLYLAICFVFHPWIGVAVLLGVVLLGSLTWVTDVLGRPLLARSLDLAAGRRAVVDTTVRNAPLIAALGMRTRLVETWLEANGRCRDTATASSDVVGGLGSVSRFLRTSLQSGVLALGALLVINDQATAGVMLAATILSTRALAPVDTTIANWRTVAAARIAWTRLGEALAATPAEPARTPLPRPARDLRLAAVSLAAPGSDTLIADGLSFEIAAGQALGVVGPSGSGKSSLARALVGTWRPVRGAIRLDGATLDQWDPDALGAALGYLPQEADLLRGTIAENISRFAPERDPAALMKAARAAGVHDLVVRFQGGYDTPVGEGGSELSGGQRQRIALARALYGDPFLVVLDEPNSNLDVEGERALSAAIAGVKERGGIAVVIAHRPSALSAVDLLLVMNEGRQQYFGPRDEVLARLNGPAAPVVAAGRPHVVRSA